MKKILLTLGIVIVSTPKVALAHCPLCTVGAGALAVLAASLGISAVVVGVMIGGFSLALSTWLAGLPKKQYIPYQYQILAFIIFLGTIIPIIPFVKDYSPVYLKIFGEYGGLFHNTYTVNTFIVGAILGTVLMLTTPRISRFVTEKRGGKTLPFQGITISLVLLILVSLIIELVI